MKQKKNIYFYILDVIICGVFFTACGMQEISVDYPPEQSEEAQTDPAISDSLHISEMNDMEDWDLSEEQLYWIDHDERITVLENPTRRFVEIRAIDTERTDTDDNGVKPYFGMLKEAEYEVMVSDNGPMLEINFIFAREPLQAEYETPLYNGYCMDEEYHMTVTDKESGEVLQEDTVRLCIDQVDMITFGDLNKDRYIDMQIDYPTHQDETYQWKHWDSPFRRFWNTEKEIFEFNGSSLYNNIKKLTEEGSREYVVQPGDCLWSISERFVGSGSYWTMLQREENAPIDPNYVLPGEIIYVPNGINFP